MKRSVRWISRRGARIVDLLKALSEEMTILLVSHDLAVVAALCEEIVILEKGKVVESGRTADILANPAHPLYAEAACERAADAGLRPAPAKYALLVDLDPEGLVVGALRIHVDPCAPDARGHVRAHHAMVDAHARADEANAFILVITGGHPCIGKPAILHEAAMLLRAVADQKRIFPRCRA